MLTRFLLQPSTKPTLRNLVHPVRSTLWRMHTTTAAAQTPVRVRFAPSPTGYLHLGGLRTALFNYLLAKKSGGQFILRIEDTDQTRFVEGATDKLISALSWAGINHDEGPKIGGPHVPYFQSKRTDTYREYADKLIQDGHAYRCFCTPERLKKVREVGQKTGRLVAYDKHCSFLSHEEVQEQLEKKTPYTVRLNTPEGFTQVCDTVYGNVQFSNKTLDDTILIKSDGFPTYHLANVVDDHLMKITHVLRGEASGLNYKAEWMPSTPKHVILYQALGWTPPQFVHLPLLMNADRTKLSKRSGDVHVEQYIAKGYLPEALNNFIALLGWNSQSEDEIFTFKELVEAFNLSQINNSNAIVDVAKLDWINKQHILKRAETAEGLQSLVDLLIPYVKEKFEPSLKDTKEASRLERNYLTSVVDTIKDRIRNIRDIPELCGYYFVKPDYTSADAKALRKKLNAQAIDLLSQTETQKRLTGLEPFDAATIKEFIHQLAESNHIKPNLVMMAFRYAVTGSRVGAGVAETMQVLGLSTCSSRLTQAFPHQ
ncbi:Glutamyl-tRNA synthetase [Apophysomyces sp. BC1034]|nr:Glutamyl-tRNA synthetase [Apophysomyces sp. BC1015]KAG0176744.1 Glutamyl-tRNA synthetase [Apophysomyces sp. BC1021]KAG0194366.1 Glutamyl-tRNA synthetase [Apophysomyces sp. BC1034]